VGLVRGRKLAVLAAAALFGTSAGTASAEPVHGGWQSVINCIPTGYDPATHKLDCVGSTLWTGTWTGVTAYHILGTFDLLSGSGSGTIRETFVGTSDDGGRGTLEWVERFVVNGATQAIRINARLVDGTADFVGATGRATFVGKSNAVTGSGTYTGHWSRPSPGD
jgi:hypothetical protein